MADQSDMALQQMLSHPLSASAQLQQDLYCLYEYETEHARRKKCCFFFCHLFILEFTHKQQTVQTDGASGLDSKSPNFTDN